MSQEKDSEVHTALRGTLCDKEGHTQSDVGTAEGPHPRLASQEKAFYRQWC